MQSRTTTEALGTLGALMKPPIGETKLNDRHEEQSEQQFEEPDQGDRELFVINNLPGHLGTIELHQESVAAIIVAAV